LTTPSLWLFNIHGPLCNTCHGVSRQRQTITDLISASCYGIAMGQITTTVNYNIKSPCTGPHNHCNKQKQTYHQRHACGKLAWPQQSVHHVQTVCHQAPCQTGEFLVTRRLLEQQGTDALLSTQVDCKLVFLYTTSSLH